MIMVIFHIQMLHNILYKNDCNIQQTSPRRFGKFGVLVQSSLLKHQSSRLDDMYLADPVAWIYGPVDWMQCLGIFCLTQSPGPLIQATGSFKHFTSSRYSLLLHVQSNILHVMQEIQRCFMFIKGIMFNTHTKNVYKLIMILTLNNI